MSLSINRFDEFFRALYRDKEGKPLDPFPWQSRLAQLVFERGWPACIDLPTASGKTACIDVAVFVLACQADRPANERTVGRRIFFTVNRRVIVDEAFERASNLAKALLAPTDGILKDVAEALRSLNEDRTNAPPLDVAQLRGGIFRDTTWARSLTQPMVVCTTADQLGSRLLFRGYGVSDSMKPIHAALTACDSLVLLDEAHVTKAFSQTMQLLTAYQQMHSSAPPLRFVQMTATPTPLKENQQLFQLDDADRANETLRNRQLASKPASLVLLKGKESIVGAIVSRALLLVSDGSKPASPTKGKGKGVTAAVPDHSVPRLVNPAVGIIVNRVQTARQIAARLQDELAAAGVTANVHLVIGRMRPLDRDALQESLRKVVGPGRPDELDEPVFIVATQCLEVGADYDFDALFTECASIDALRQRFGRLNRRARRFRDGRPIEVAAAIITNEESIKGDDPIYGEAIQHTWGWLTETNRTSVDFGIAAFKTLWDAIDDKRRDEMLAPAPNAAVLLPAHLDALCQTAPLPDPSPDVSYFIHGPQRDNAEVSVCWRADLGEDATLWPRVVQLLPPTSPECMTVPLIAVRKWMIGNIDADRRDADVAVRDTPDDESEGSASDPHRVVIWRGTKDVAVTAEPQTLRPGDTVVIRTQGFGWEAFGHIPGAPLLAEYTAVNGRSDDHSVSVRTGIERRRDEVDRAEISARESRRRVVVRLHSIFPHLADLRGLRANDLRKALVGRGVIPADWNGPGPAARFERRRYREDFDDAPTTPLDEVIVFNRLTDEENALRTPKSEEDDGNDSSSESDYRVPLELHTAHVVARANAASTLAGGLERVKLFQVAADLHDLGKADIRFQALLGGVTPYEAMMWPTLLAKSDQRKLSSDENRAVGERALCPKGFRHEMLSMQIVEHFYARLVTEKGIDRDLLLHLIEAHHGHGRPFAPVVIDSGPNDLLSIDVKHAAITVGDDTRLGWVPAHRLDSGVAERFWNLTREHGWWGLAYLEAILRLADHQASAAEQVNNDGVAQ